MNGTWWRTESALGRVLPATLVTVLLAVPRGVVAIGRWTVRARPDGSRFTHHRDTVVLLWVVVVLTILEGAVVDVVLRFVLGPSPWVWIALGLHATVVCMILAVHAGMATRPHTLHASVLRLRTGLATEVAVAVTSIDQARPGRYPDFDRSGWRIDEDGNATLAVGEANLRLTLAADAGLTVNGRARTAPRAVHLTVDEPRRLAAAIAAAREPSRP